MVYHSHNVEYLLRAQQHGRSVALLTRWAEGRLLRDADIATAVSEVDQDHFAHLYGVRPILLPNGVDTRRFGAPVREVVDRMRGIHHLDRHTLLFAGFYAYGPNLEAINFLVESVMPALRDRYPSATLALTGGGAPYQEPWIKNAGAIPYDDFPAFVSACGVAVAPIFSGSGTRLKILEAMAAGIPVVATEKAAEGLALIPGGEILLARDGGEFVESIGALFENPALGARLCERASRKVAADFSWQALTRDFEAIISEVAAPLLSDGRMSLLNS